MKNKHWVYGLAHCAIWVVALVICERLTSDSAASSAYALICAWWATLYSAAILETRWRAVPFFLMGMILALAIDATAMSGLLYHDIPSPVSTGFLGVAALLCVFWVSPFAVNAFVLWIRNRIRQ